MSDDLQSSLDPDLDDPVEDPDAEDDEISVTYNPDDPLSFNG